MSAFWMLQLNSYVQTLYCEYGNGKIKSFLCSTHLCVLFKMKYDKHCGQYVAGNIHWKTTVFWCISVQVDRSSFCLISHCECDVFRQSTPLNRWCGLCESCGGGCSTITVNDTPPTALQPALQAAKSGREGVKVGMKRGNEPPYFNKFTWRALAACKWPTSLADM